MAQPTPFALSQFFSQLIGRKVAFTRATQPPESTTEQVFGLYRVLPSDTTIVVTADLPLLGSFAGLLVDLPDAAVSKRLGVRPIDELMRDAMYEVLNIASAGVTEEGRAVLKKMVHNAAYVDGDAGNVLRSSDHRSYFHVAVDGYRGGRFNIFAQIVPAAFSS